MIIYKQVLPKLKDKQTIDNELVTTLYMLSEKSQTTAIGFAALITIFMYSELSYYILLWGITLGAISLFRLYSIYLFKTYSQKYTLETWYRKFIIVSLLTALIVSSLGIVFIHYVDDYYQMFILAALLAASSVATISLSSDFRIALAYISIILIPLIASTVMLQTPMHLVLSILLTLFFLSQILMIFNNHTQDEKIKELYKEIKNQKEYNQHLLDNNKQFIADMVHQIRTPLTVIMTNTSLIEMQSERKVSSYTTQINSAINMLSNSYEDLSYIISNDTIEYKLIEINFTDFLKERIHFFEVIAHANDKTIYANIDNAVKISMNDTELERLIDNNLSNAIKHSSDKSEMEIVLEKNHSGVVLEFISKGKNIRDVSMIFDKNYTETYGAKRSLGLGLNMVKMICEKNGIAYSAHSDKSINTFTYVFKV